MSFEISDELKIIFDELEIESSNSLPGTFLKVSIDRLRQMKFDVYDNLSNKIQKIYFPVSQEDFFIFDNTIGDIIEEIQTELLASKDKYHSRLKHLLGYIELLLGIAICIEFTYTKKFLVTTSYYNYFNLEEKTPLYVKGQFNLKTAFQLLPYHDLINFLLFR